MDLKLDGKRALIAGGSMGIGKAVAGLLAEEGAHVAIVGRDEARARAVAEDIAARHRVTAIASPCDTGQDASVDAMGRDVADRLGGIDIVVNCAAEPAGQARPPSTSELDHAYLDRHMNVKVMGYLRVAQAAMPHMVRQGWGRIISVSGTGMYRPGDTAGAIRNAGVVAMSKNLAHDLAGTGVTTSVVHPGMTRTEKVDAMLQARAEAAGHGFEDELDLLAKATLNGVLPDAMDMAWIIAFLASPLSSAINGEVITATGGRPGVITY